MKILLFILIYTYSFSYNRNGAIEYANKYAQKPNHECGNYQSCTPSSYWGNEACDYAQNYGDVANFVS